MSEQVGYTPIVETIKLHFLNTVEVVKSEHPKVSFYPDHVREVEKWSLKILNDYPQADREVVLLGVWLHDIGNMIGDRTVDHAIRSTTEAAKILPVLGLSKQKTGAVTHCIRAHRNKDVEPQTLEAKIVAAADSASHMTGDAYLAFASRGNKASSLAKLERDYRDLGLIPGLQEKLTPFYKAWKNLLEVYPDL